MIAHSKIILYKSKQKSLQSKYKCLLLTHTQTNEDNQMQTIQMSVTPELAKTWLQSNTNNRTPRQNHVDFLVNEIKTGAWKITHQGIAFSTDMVLLDGQHRLMAIAKSGVTVQMLVTFGLESDSMSVIDGAQIVRSSFDRMRLLGEDDWKCWISSIAIFNLLTSEKKLSVDKIQRLANQLHPNCIDIFVRLNSCTKIRTITQAPNFAAVVLFVNSHPDKKDDALRFLDILLSGEYDASKNGELTVIKYRQFLIKNTEKYSSSGSHLRAEVMNICQYALSKFLAKTNVSRMQKTENLLYPRITL